MVTCCIMFGFLLHNYLIGPFISINMSICFKYEIMLSFPLLSSSHHVWFSIVQQSYKTFHVAQYENMLQTEILLCPVYTLLFHCCLWCFSNCFFTVNLIIPKTCSMLFPSMMLCFLLHKQSYDFFPCCARWVYASR